jgi:hypothetical protein
MGFRLWQEFRRYSQTLCPKVSENFRLPGSDISDRAREGGNSEEACAFFTGFLWFPPSGRADRGTMCALPRRTRQTGYCVMKVSGLGFFCFFYPIRVILKSQNRQDETNQASSPVFPEVHRCLRGQFAKARFACRANGRICCGLVNSYLTIWLDQRRSL